MANYSRGWAGTVTQGTTTDMWTNLAGATVSDDNRAACTVVANSDSEWLIATNFAFQRTVPSGATVVGVMVLVEGFSTPIDEVPTPSPVFLQDARLVIGGTIQTGGPSVGLGKPLGRGDPAERYELIAGTEGDLWGQTPTQAQAAASNFGVALKFRVLNASHVARVDSIRLVIWWEKTPGCVITSKSPTSGGQAPFQYVAHANDSIWGSDLPHEVLFEWTVTGPSGWSQTVEDPRRGGWPDPTRSLATLYGKCPQWLFDVPGEYTVNCTMYRTNSNGTYSTTAATPVTVTVNASTRPKRYVKQGGNDRLSGESIDDAWATLYKASTAAPNSGAEIIVMDDGTITEAALPYFNPFAKLWIHRSGTGTNPPTITHSGSFSLSEFVACTDTVIQGLRFQYNSSVGSRPYAVKGHSNTRLCLVDVSHDGCDSFCEFSDSGTQEGVLLLRCDGTDHRRYMLYSNGANARYVAAIGGRWQTSRPSGAEGHLRVTNVYNDATLGVGLLMAFVHTSSSGSTPYSSCRHGWAEQDVYANRLESLSTFNLSHYAFTDRHSWEMNSRYEANDLDYGGSLPWGERSHYVLFASNYLRVSETEQIGDNGVSLSYQLCLNTLLIVGATSMFLRTKAPGAGGTLHDGIGHTVVGNLWLSELPPGNTPTTTWSGKYWRNDETDRSLGAIFSFNVYNDDGTGTGNVTRWTEVGTNYTLSGWNGLAIASDEIKVSPLHGGTGGTLPQASNSWALSPTTFPTTRHVPPSAVRGVFFDYRLVMRNPSVSSGVWAAGCTGDET